MHEHARSESVINVVDDCGDALCGVMAYAKRWHMDARLAVRVWASRWKGRSMLECADSRQVRQAWHAFAGSFRAYKLANHDEIRTAALKKERAHLQGIHNRTIKSMKRSEMQNAFSRNRRMLHESQQLAQAHRKLLQMELKAKTIRQLDADKLDEEDMRKVELDTHIARLAVLTTVSRIIAGSTEAGQED